MKEEAKTCLQCDKILRGRSDKKFCDDYCRNNYNNQLKAHANNYVRNINNTLSKNRRILEEMLPAEKETINTQRQRLLQSGFSFKYITHILKTKKGTYFFCYDYGYLPFENDWYLIVRSKEE
ncbi:MAG TPA: hypothetical protein VGI61_07335 [Parafilimonas sp.]|jgi:hypothetical protein